MERRTLSERTLAALDTYFFSERRLIPLGLLRIFLVFFSIERYMGNILRGISFQDPQLYALHERSFLVKLLSYPFGLLEENLLVFALLYYLAAGCALIGLFTRPALFLFGLFTLYLTGVTTSHGIFNHEASLVSQVLILLAFVPGTKALSADNAIKWFFKTKDKTIASLGSALAGARVPVWGYKLLLLLLAFTYFTAGVSKIRYGGLQWLDGKTLTHYMDGSASPFTEGKKPIFISPPDVPEEAKWKDGFGIYSFSFGNRQASPFWRATGEAIVANRFYITTLTVLSVFFELAAFTMLFAGWPRTLYLLGAIMMHNSIGVLMNLPFSEYQILCFFLIDWRWVLNQLQLRFSRKRSMAAVTS